MKKLINILTTSIFAMLMAVANVFAYEVGEIIKFGSYHYEANGTVRPIEWRVLANDGSKALLITKNGIDVVPYNKAYVNITWADSSIRKWLNNEFLNKAFTPDQQSKIIKSNIENKNNAMYGTRGGVDTNDKLFLLSIEEANKYFKSDDDRETYPTPYAKKRGVYTNDNYGGSCWCWLRSPGSNQNEAAYVSNYGIVVSGGRNVNNGEVAVRVALWLDLGILESTQTNGESAAAKKVVSETKSQTAVGKTSAQEAITFLSARRKNPDAIAVIIGAKNYDSNISAVEYAHNDASAIKDLAIKTLGYDPENIIYETDPTKGKLEQIFGTKDSHEGMLYNWIKPGKSDVLVYYTGHGAPDQGTKTAFFVPKDANPDYIRIGGYSMETLYENLARLPAKKITVITDACFSGQGGNGKMIIKSASPLAITAKIPVANNGSNSKMTVFNAGNGDEMASWYDAKQHSLFTYYFLLGMSGQADTNKDKTITAGELDDYLQENVPYRARRMYNREQHPVFTGNRNAPLATYK